LTAAETASGSSVKWSSTSANTGRAPTMSTASAVNAAEIGVVSVNQFKHIMKETPHQNDTRVELCNRSTFLRSTSISKSAYRWLARRRGSRRRCLRRIKGRLGTGRGEQSTRNVELRRRSRSLYIIAQSENEDRRIQNINQAGSRKRYDKAVRCGQ